MNRYYFTPPIDDLEHMVEYIAQERLRLERHLKAKVIVVVTDKPPTVSFKVAWPVKS